MAKIKNPLIIIGGKENFGKYHIEQVIEGNYCELVITDISTETENNYYVGQADTEQKGYSDMCVVEE